MSLPQTQKKETKTVLKCLRCGYVEERPFQQGDYVMKVTDKLCPRDGTPLVIWGIYTVKPQNKPQ